MNIEPFFDDERHRRSEVPAFQAERAERALEIEEARRLYSEAARLEEENAWQVPSSIPSVRSVLAISAVALWWKAEEWDEAARVGCRFLSEPAGLTTDAVHEIESLVDRGRKTSPNLR